jgi:hypothetical protein
MADAPKTFEDCYADIQTEVSKRRNLWNLSSITWLDFDDVSQIILIHIYTKWHKYDQSKPLIPWLNKVISHQIKNIIRNIYGNYVRPCLRCAAAEGENLCKIYVTQCSKCPLYAGWERSKKQAYGVKITVPIENHLNQTECSATDAGYVDTQDIDAVAKTIHSHMEKTLKPIEWTVYKALFIDNVPEEQIALQMGYKSNESGRKPGYKQLKNIRRQIMEKVKVALYKNEIDII